jgi:RimJ/RimL family protein N-acetyltransferase
VGYRLFKKHWGKGYASEACKRTIEYGFNDMNLARIVAHARKENSASLRVLEKCGMKVIGEGKECGGEIFVLEILRA